ncbi:hypothetical protein FDUTEX481_03025 [Tolypothrix sp. PCC 7601]|nr:hypothetical protein FDUTEX481_03025 [Tolypothrix sp. PCC 7601]
MIVVLLFKDSANSSLLFCLSFATITQLNLYLPVELEEILY